MTDTQLPTYAVDGISEIDNWRDDLIFTMFTRTRNLTLEGTVEQRRDVVRLIVPLAAVRGMAMQSSLAADEVRHAHRMFAN